jgi:hypothetical protein
VYVIEKSGDGTTSWYRIYQSWHHGFILAEWLGISKFQSNGLFGSLYDEYKKFGLGKKLNLSQVYDFMQSITDLIKEKYGPEAGIEMFIPDIDIIRTPSKQYWAAALENFPIAQSGSEINSLLLYSVHQADNEIARYALENSANVNTRYNDNSTALIVAIKMFNNELISLLLNRPDIDVSVIPNDLFKRSAFQLATTTKNKKAVKLLLKTGKQFRKKDFNFIQSVLPDKEIEKLLLNATATP